MFPKEDIRKQIELLQTSPAKYVIAVDKTEQFHSYCLTCRRNDTFSVLMIKCVPANNSFDEEVENLSKYFNAKIIKEVN